MLIEMKMKSRKERVNQLVRNKAMSIMHQQSPKPLKSPDKRLSILVTNSNHTLKDRKPTLRAADLFALKSKEDILKDTMEKLREMSVTLQTDMNVDAKAQNDLEYLLSL